MVKRYFIGFMLLFMAMPLYAVQLKGLYSASVAVVDQSQTVRNKAMSAALKKVVQKVSGRRGTLNDVSLQAALSNVSAYVEQFQYKRRDDEVQTYWLTVSFQKAALDKVMKQFGVPVWGSNRPDVLLWIAVDDGRKRYIANADTVVMGELLQQAAQGAGLAVTLPLLDLQDQRSIGFNDIWAGFPDQVLRASQRYGVKHVMFGRLLKQGENQIRLNWSLLSNEGRQDDLAQSDDMERALNRGFEQLAESLASIYAPMGVSVERALTLEVSHVNDLATFVNVTRYLSSLDMVSKLSWSELREGQVTLQLTVSGDLSVLKEVIALNSVLTPDLMPRVPVSQPVGLQQLPAQSMSETFYYRVH